MWAETVQKAHFAVIAPNLNMECRHDSADGEEERFCGEGHTPLHTPEHGTGDLQELSWNSCHGQPESGTPTASVVFSLTASTLV